MGLKERAKADIESITSNTNEWACPITFISPDGLITATINGIHTKHHLNVDTEGNAVNAKKATISVSEKFLIDAGYPVRNSSNEVSLNGHRIKAKDSTGILCDYILLSIFPNETIGLLTCILEDYTE